VLVHSEYGSPDGVHSESEEESVDSDCGVVEEGRSRSRGTENDRSNELRKGSFRLRTVSRELLKLDECRV
jgi:hypothetical protein